jgi:flagellar assembly factor FliW
LTITGSRFGNIEYEDPDVITFHDGLVGFPSVTRFVILCPREDKPFRWLQSIDEPGLAFLITDPEAYVSGYAPLVGLSIARELSLEPNTPRLLFTTVNIPRGKPDEMTINLAGPLVINALERKGKQIVLEDGAYTTKYRVFQMADRVSGENAA